MTRKTVWPVLEAAGVNPVRLSRATAGPPLGSEPVGSPSGTVRGVQLRLDGPDGNAFDLPGTFQAAARHQGWTAEAIRAVFTGANAGDQTRLLAVLAEYAEPPATDDVFGDVDSNPPTVPG